MRAHDPLRTLAVAMAVLGAASAGCGGWGPVADGAALATYDGGEVTLDEFDAHVQREAVAGRSLADREGDWRVSVLEELALREIVAASASSIDDPQLQASIRAAEDSIYAAAMKRHLDWTEITISSEEVRRYYDEHPEIFVDPEKLRLQHIFLRSEKATAASAERLAARQKLEGIRRQIIDGADFAAMAQEHSDSADGPAGGWMVLKRGARAVKSFTEVAWALKPDEVSGIIDTPAGFHVARLATRVPPVERSFEDVREFATAETLKVARRKLELDYLEAKGPLYGLERDYSVLADPAVEDDSVLFSLDGEAFTVLDLLRELPDKYLPHFFGGYLEHIPRVIDDKALGRILVLEAVKAGITEDETVRADAAAAVAELKAGAEIDRRLVERSQETTEEELRDYYEQNKNRYETFRTRSISMIRLPIKGEATWALLKKGERLVKAIRAGADFAELARRESRHVSAAEGGRLLDQNDDDLRVRVQGRARGRRVIDDLAVGEVSDAFVGEVYDAHKLRFVPTGVYIVRIDSETPPRQAPFEEVEELARANHLRRYYSRFIRELRADMLAEANFRVVKANLPELGK